MRLNTVWNIDMPNEMEKASVAISCGLTFTPWLILV